MYSLLDSIIKPEELVDKLKQMGSKGIAITDHGNVHASVYMYKLLKQNNMKFIYGCEFYICNDMKVKDPKNRYSHLVILAKNEQGRQNINKLVTIAERDGFYYKPRIDFNTLKKYKDGLIILSACMAGEISKALLDNDIQKARQIALKYKSEFGEDYYLEYQSHSEETQQKLNRMIVDLANELDIKYVVTTDAHYLNKEDQKYHDVFVAIGQEREVGETYNDCYIQTQDEVLDICKSTTKEENLKAIQTTYEIADKCNVEIPLSPPQIPHVEIPKKFKSELDYLKYLCIKGWKDREIYKLPKKDKIKYKNRLAYEMNAIDKMGFAGYYLLVHSYVTKAKRKGIARGSGGGSLVAFLIGIIELDPIKYGLYFERFIDVGALDKLKKGEITLSEVKIPDFDIDFGKEDRDRILQYIIDAYGQNRVFNLGSFQYMWAKGAIKDIGKVLGIPFSVTNEMTKQFGNESIEEVLEKGLLEDYEEQYPELFEYAKKIAGLPKSFSMHPCGVIISMKDADYYSALSVNDDGSYTLQGDMRDAEDLGLVKIDLLGLRTVDVIYDTLDMINKDSSYVDPNKMNLNDKNVLNEFAKGNTFGVFQFESTGMQKTLREINVSSLNDIIVANALFRPGSKKYIETYARRKRGEEPIKYLHNDLKDILSVTYGIIVFQEQLIEIGRLAKLKNPDMLRKATGKKDEELMKQVEPELREGLYKRGWTKEQVDQLWDDMMEFARYSFNKSHSAAYALTAYICAYLKYYHPVEYMCALLNSYEGKSDKIGETISEIRKMGIDIEFDIANISDICYVKNNKIYYGTALIKGNNKETGQQLMQFKNKQYDYLVDLFKDIEDNYSLTKKHEMLIKLGYFDKFYPIKTCQKLLQEFKKGKYRYHKNLKEKTQAKRIVELRKIEDKIKNEDISIKEKICNQLELLEATTFCEPRINEKYYMVLDIKTTRYNPIAKLHNIKTGYSQDFWVGNTDLMAREPFKKFDIIKILDKTSKTIRNWIRVN